MLSFSIVPVEPILAHVYVAKRHGKPPEQQTGQKIKSPRDKYHITYRLSSPKEQAMDLFPYGTDQHWDPLNPVVNIFYLSRTSGISKLMPKHLHISKVLRNVGVYPLSCPHPEGYTIFPVLTVVLHTMDSQERKKVQITISVSPCVKAQEIRGLILMSQTPIVTSLWSQPRTIGYNTVQERTGCD